MGFNFGQSFVYIDYENIHLSLLKHHNITLVKSSIQKIYDLSKQIGENIKLVYAFADWRNFSSIQEELDSFGANLIPVPNVTKNSSDIALVVRATANLYENKEVGNIILFAGDGGYIPLVKHIKSLEVESEIRKVFLFSVKGTTSGDIVRLADDHKWIEDVFGISTGDTEYISTTLIDQLTENIIAIMKRFERKYGYFGINGLVRILLLDKFVLEEKEAFKILDELEKQGVFNRLDPIPHKDPPVSE
jgi:uncharacterized LabA/DUF88 family protein